jgi:DNA/RNA endonuclease YhcR with UshA esterase domain
MRMMTFRARKLALAPLAALIILGAWRNAVADAFSLSPGDAIKHVNQTATVCGIVVSAKYATSSEGQPTFLNLDKPYPNNVFTAVIWGSDRAAFPYAPESLADRRICVTGTVKLYRGKAEIIVSGPSQIRKVE